jgi:protein TonB
MRISFFLSPNSTLKWALAISLGIHAALLTLRFAAPETFKRVFDDAPMEVILVNARSPEKSDSPQALAQANLAGGGQSPGQLVATSPLPPALQSEDGQDVNNAPRKRYISPATREVAYALYYDKLRRAIETNGTQNFPQAAGQKLYGAFTMLLTVNSQGQLIEAEIVRTSGNPLLDSRALAIARNTAPFDAFSAKMRKSADQIVVVSRFRFKRDETLKTVIQIPDE